MGIIKNKRRKESTKSKTLQIAFLKNELSLCKKKIRKLRSISTNGYSNFEILTLNRDLEVEILKKEALMRKLSLLGVTEKRGRPKKNDTEKYSHTRSKFTAMLLPDNLTYLKKLKDTGKINNISAFLDSLIEDHRLSHKKT